jgi:hypothetical protein
MATFTIDLLTGNLYLFSGNFSGSGSTPTSGSTYPQVNLYSDLPPAATVASQIYMVRNGSGSYVLNRKPSGFYFSTGIVWRFLGDTPDFFKSSNFQIYDSVDSTKGVMFTTSGISTNIFRRVKIQNSDGTIAYLTDLNIKLDTSVFADYTGTTVPATYLTKAAFNSYTGATALLIGGKQNTLIAGTGIRILGNTISVTGGTQSSLYSALQLVDLVGGVQVNNVSALPISWTQEFTGTSLNFTGGSRVYVLASGVYEISYVLNIGNDTSSPKNIGTIIRKNGNTDITPLSTSSFSYDLSNNGSSNIMPPYQVLLPSGSYIELMAFRIGTTGNVYTKTNGSWLKIKRIN